MAREWSVVLAVDDAVPTVYCRIVKDEGRFVYAVSLWVIQDGQSVEIAKFDNSHEDGQHHCHKFYKNSAERRESFDFSRFGTIGKLVDHLQETWRDILRRYNE